MSRGSLYPREKLHFKILAPFRADVPVGFDRAVVDQQVHSKLIFDTQLVRGQALSELGQIKTHLLPDGRHYQKLDFQSWHILLQNSAGKVLGCARYRPVTGGFEHLAASQSAIAQSNRYGPVLKLAVENHIANARNHNIQYGEAGAWALRREIRGSTAGVNIALMTWALAAYLGGGMGITTATRTNHSASILRRLGGRRLPNLPAYYEPKYGAVIEILVFSLAQLDQRYACRLEKVKEEIDRTPVICAAEGKSALAEVPLHTLPMPFEPRPSAFQYGYTATVH